jgi:hypothetical protein
MIIFVDNLGLTVGRNFVGLVDGLNMKMLPAGLTIKSKI